MRAEQELNKARDEADQLHRFRLDESKAFQPIYREPLQAWEADRTLQAWEADAPRKLLRGPPDLHNDILAWLDADFLNNPNPMRGPPVPTMTGIWDHDDWDPDDDWNMTI